jgi:hypothetical protein
MAHMKKLNGSLGGIGPLCWIDQCPGTDACVSEPCYIYDSCGIDYGEPCKFWDSCSSFDY